MPDWLTHTLAGWITGKTIKMDVGLVVIGSLIPDLMKINLAFRWFGIDQQYFLEPIHTPVCAFLIGGLIALFFLDVKKAFIAIGCGISTHFILDLFIISDSTEGMKLLFPFSWKEWRYNMIYADDYKVTIFAIITAIVIYILYLYYEKRNYQKKSC